MKKYLTTGVGVVSKWTCYECGCDVGESGGYFVRPDGKPMEYFPFCKPCGDHREGDFSDIWNPPQEDKKT